MLQNITNNGIKEPEMGEINQKYNSEKGIYSLIKKVMHK